MHRNKLRRVWDASSSRCQAHFKFQWVTSATSDTQMNPPPSALPSSARRGEMYTHMLWLHSQFCFNQTLRTCRTRHPNSVLHAISSPPTQTCPSPYTAAEVFSFPAVVWNVQINGRKDTLRRLPIPPSHTAGPPSGSTWPITHLRRENGDRENERI